MPCYSLGGESAQHGEDEMSLFQLIFRRIMRRLFLKYFWPEIAKHGQWITDEISLEHGPHQNDPEIKREIHIKQALAIRIAWYIKNETFSEKTR